MTVEPPPVKNEPIAEWKLFSMPWIRWFNGLVDSINAISSELTSKGDILTHDGNGNVTLPVGTDGQALTADSSVDSGISWQTPAGGGDMLIAVYDPSGISEQLVGLTATQTLTGKSGNISMWTNDAGYIVATDSFIKGYRSESTAITFTSTDYHVEQQTPSLTDTLPLTSTLTNGQVFVYSNVASGSTTLTASGSDTIYTSSGAVTSVTVYDGETKEVQVRPSGGWKLI